MKEHRDNVQWPPVLEANGRAHSFWIARTLGLGWHYIVQGNTGAKKKKVKILPFLRKMDPAKNPEHSEQSEFSSKLREAALQPLESLGLSPSYLS